MAGNNTLNHQIFLDKNHHWETSLLSNSYNTFVKKLINQGKPKQEQKWMRITAARPQKTGYIP
jgi:hypothetical protein